MAVGTHLTCQSISANPPLAHQKPQSQSSLPEWYCWLCLADWLQQAVRKQETIKLTNKAQKYRPERHNLYNSRPLFALTSIMMWNKPLEPLKLMSTHDYSTSSHAPPLHHLSCLPYVCANIFYTLVTIFLKREKKMFIVKAWHQIRWLR